MRITGQAGIGLSASSTLLALVALAGCSVSELAPITPQESPQPGMIVASAAESTAVGFPEFLAVSPDGQFVAFAWGGDLWISPIQGGSSSRLTVHPAEERRPAFSPDGQWLAFESNRDGARNLYVMPLAKSATGIVGGSARRVTSSDRPQGLGGFSADGRSLVFSSGLDPSIYRAARMYTVPLLNDEVGGLWGGPIERLTDAFGSLPRSGSSGTVFQRGNASADRPKYRGTGTTEVWRLSSPSPSGTEQSLTRVTVNPANDFDAWPLPDGSTVFLSSRDGQNNVWRVGPGGESSGAAVQLTNFKPADGQLSIGAGVRDLAVSADGRVAAFCVWDRM